MPDIRIIAAGRLKPGPLRDLSEEYKSRIRWPLEIIEIGTRLKDAAGNADENKKIREKIRQDSMVLALDARGRVEDSESFATLMQRVDENPPSRMDILIGGADGLDFESRTRARLILSFGRQTWPHMLARVMLLEQIYRARQILDGHPYHRA